jgi:hypothetical protein
MMKTGKVAMKIDSVRVYQSKDDGAHPGKPHTVGCDPVEFPTREYIKGFEFRYMRNPPFVYDDKHPLREVKNGGGECEVDADCGGGGAENTDEMSVEQPSSVGSENESDVIDLDSKDNGSDARESQSPLASSGNEASSTSQTKTRTSRTTRWLEQKSDSKEKSDSSSDSDSSSSLQKPPVSSESLKDQAGDTKVTSNPNRRPKGSCMVSTGGLFGTVSKKQCKCNAGYTGPHCLSVDKHDDAPGAYEMKKVTTLFQDMPHPYLTRQHVLIGGILAGTFLVFLVGDKLRRGRQVVDRNGSEMTPLHNQ